MTEHAPPTPNQPPADEADVIVVGAGPAGATTAFYLAQSGLDVLLLEKSRFPREKVCGDGLTPGHAAPAASGRVNTAAPAPSQVRLGLN